VLRCSFSAQQASQATNTSCMVHVFSHSLSDKEYEKTCTMQGGWP
jgi:hypothetical protein